MSVTVRQKPLRILLAGLAVGAAVGLASAPALAHRAWLLPSMTVLSKQGEWITVDAARSNTLFVFEHRPMAIDGLVVKSPNGDPVEAQNVGEGELRTSFDLKLDQAGTYRISVVDRRFSGSYMDKGERQRVRARSADELAKAIPAGAPQAQRRKVAITSETFVTVGAPTTDVFTPAGDGLEMVPVTHPTDLYAGEEARFRFLLNGEPAAGLEVQMAQATGLFGDETGGVKLTTDDQGIVAFSWPAPGYYWMSTAMRGEAADADGLVPSYRYNATFAVLPQ